MSEKIEIELDEDEINSVKFIWEEVIQKRMREEALEIIGWRKLEDFVSDVFRQGMNSTSKNPMEFVKNKILSEFPILKEEVKEEKIEEDFKKMYR